jgi:YVTN family beta-propeller protein
VAWNSIDRRLYTANARATNISVIDGNSLTVIDTVSLAYGPTSLHWVRDRNRLYVGVADDCRVYVIDCAAGQVVATLPAGPAPYSCFADSPASDKVYCGVYSVTGNPSWSIITAVDGGSSRVLAEITTGPNLTSLLWYPDSNWLYATLFRSMVVVDCETDTVLSMISDLRGASDMALNTRNNSIYVAHGSYEGPPYEILVIDAATRQIRKRVSLGERPFRVAWNSEKNEVYVGSIEDATTGRVYVIDCEADSLVAEILTPGCYVSDAYWNPVDNLLYCTDGPSDTVYVLDTYTRRVAGALRVRGWPVPMAWDPVTNRTYVGTVDGSNATVLRGGPPGVAGPAGAPVISRPAGPTIVRGFLNLQSAIWYLQSGIVLLDVTGRKVMDLLPGENDVRHLSPGVYFLRSADSGERPAVRKVVVQR